MYVASFDVTNVGHDPWAMFLMKYRFVAAAYLIFAAMVFDALDGRLARFARHTTDFGGQLDSLADVVSFGAAPAFLALQVFKFSSEREMPLVVSRLIWAIGALYFSCAAIRLARFNVSNEHGEQHHFSFLGLPSPGAGGAVAAFILMQQDLIQEAIERAAANLPHRTVDVLATSCTYFLPIVVLGTGLLMVSEIRYPHLVNRYLRGKRSFARLILVVGLLLLLVVKHQYTLGIGMLVYAFQGFFSWLYHRARRRTYPPQQPALP
jgi:CDP-diacylglycerol--serine O-phosphatidyltransferase